MNRFAPLSLCMLLLAGCSTGGADDAIQVSAPADPTTGAYVFTAGVDASEYTWDFGDGRPGATGRTAEHTYGVAAGTFTVRLTADGATHTHQLTIGEASNGQASFSLTVPKVWYVTGEPVRFSAAASTDPDGDPLLYRWNCFREGDLPPLGGHDHGNAGPSFGTLPEQAIAVSYGPVAAEPDRVASGDLCAPGAIRADPHFHPDATVEGTFTQPGKYRITLFAKDPGNPSVSGYFQLVVSDPADRPEQTFTHAWNGTFAAGYGGDLQQVPDTLGQDVLLDRMVVSFALEMPASALWLNLSHDMTEVSEVSYVLKKGATVLAPASTEGQFFENPSVFIPGTYTIEIQLEQGAQTEWRMSADGVYILDPSHRFELH